MKPLLKMTPSLQDYIEVIFLLAEENGQVRLTDIASRLNNTKASASQAVAVLKSMEMVEQVRYGPITLTRAGKEYALQIRHKHQLLKEFLINILGVSPKTAEEDACLMEHTVSEETLNQITSFMENRV